MKSFQFFDCKQGFAVAEKKLAHWAQAGTIAFITWRTSDSLPVAAQRNITDERKRILRQHGLNAFHDWKRALSRLPDRERGRAQQALFEVWDRQLDIGAGACLLASAEFSQIVAESLRRFDEDRYFLTDFVVMPNHVHLLAAFATEDSLLMQCTSWKRFTGTQINKALGRKGEFWQVEQFDHLVRSSGHFEYFRRYIADNPSKARLSKGSYYLYSKAL